MKKKAIISLLLDAVSYNLMSHNLYDVISKYITLDRSSSLLLKMKPLFAFTGIGVTILTGKYPYEHKIWDLFAFGKGEFSRYRKLFNILEKSPNSITKYIFNLGVLPLTLTTKLLKGESFLGVKFTPPSELISLLSTLRYTLNVHPFLANNINGIKTITGRILHLKDVSSVMIDPQILVSIVVNKSGKATVESKHLLKESFLKRQVRDMKMLDLLFKKIKTLSFSNKLIAYAHLTYTDSYMHEQGLRIDHLRDHMNLISKKLSDIVDYLSNKGYDVTFIMFSDHGMYPVRKKINITDLIRRLKSVGSQVILMPGSTVVKVRVYNSNLIDKVYKTINDYVSSFNELKLLQKDELAKLKAPLEKDIMGDFIIACNSGVYIIPNLFTGYKSYKFMHGYYDSLRHEELYPFVLISTSNPDVLYEAKDIIKRHNYEMPSIYELLLRFLNN